MNQIQGVFVSASLKKRESVSRDNNGAIGIDLNSDHIAYIETDRYGNPVRKKTISWVCYGKTKDQLKAMTGDICKEIVNKAKETKKPIIIEKLDFQKKKLSLQQDGNKKFARLLSSLLMACFS